MTATTPPASTGPAKAARPGARRRVNTRARLLEAAEDVFVRKGLGRTTVDDLVAAAGFTRGAFYSNFSSIEEVFFAVFAQQSEQMLHIVEDAVRAIPEGEFSMESMATVLDAVQPLSARWYVLQTECTLLALRRESVRAFLQEHRDRFEDQMGALITEVVGRLGRTPTIPVEQLTETAIALYVHSLGQAGLGFGTLEPDELVRTVLPGVILGLSRET